MSERTETISYEVVLAWKADPNMARGRQMIRFTGTPEQLRVVMDCAEANGFTVEGFRRFDSMTAEDAIKFIVDELRVVAFITQKATAP